jgi:hypothetical protein
MNYSDRKYVRQWERELHGFRITDIFSSARQLFYILLLVLYYLRHTKDSLFRDTIAVLRINNDVLYIFTHTTKRTVFFLNKAQFNEIRKDSFITAISVAT